jgi:ATP adenylyltransferase
MEPFNVCRFCDIIDGRYHYEGIDEPFASNDNFIAIASIGALIEGWSLIIPKKHQLSMKNVYNNSNINDLINSILPNMMQKDGSLIAFEHGANKEGSITACGTDHAHLHIVPFVTSLIPDLDSSGLQWIHCHTSEIALKSKNREYLFYTELRATATWQDPAGYLHVLDYPISQFFRQIIATHLGRIEMSDYKRFPHLDIAVNTRKMQVRLAA